MHTASPVDSSPAVVWMVGDCLVVRNEMDALTETISDKSPVSLIVNNTIKIMNTIIQLVFKKV